MGKSSARLIVRSTAKRMQSASPYWRRAAHGARFLKGASEFALRVPAVNVAAAVRADR